MPASMSMTKKELLEHCQLLEATNKVLRASLERSKATPQTLTLPIAINTAKAVHKEVLLAGRDLDRAASFAAQWISFVIGETQSAVVSLRKVPANGPGGLN